jgi:hypothetical protein
MASNPQIEVGHTLGPWRIAHSGYANTPFVVYAGENEPQFANRNRFPLQGVNWIAEVKHDESEQHKEQIANVQLIAAAPDLLSALKAADALLKSIYRYCNSRMANNREVNELISAVIAKATGIAGSGQLPTVETNSSHAPGDSGGVAMSSPRKLCADHKVAQIAGFSEDQDAIVVESGDCVICERNFDRASEAGQ